MTKSIDSLTNENTFGVWKDKTNVMAVAFTNEVLTLGDTASLNPGNLALTGNIDAGGTLTFTATASGTITHGTLVDITQKTNIAQTLQIVSSSATELRFAKTHNAVDAWEVKTDSAHNNLIIQKASAGTTRKFIFDSTDGSISAENFIFNSGLLPNITGTKISDNSIDSQHYVDTSIDTEHLNIGGTSGITKFLRCSNTAGTTMEWDTPPSTVYAAGTGIQLGTVNIDGVDVQNAFSVSDQNTKLNLSGGTLTGDTTVSDNIRLYFGNDGTADVGFFSNGANMYTDLGSSITNWYIRDLDNSSNNDFTFTKGGQFTASDDITAFSDRTLKENIISIPNALDKVCAIGGYTFDRTDIVRDRQTGVIAQEVLEVLPEAVHQNEDGIYSVAYGNMVGLLVEAIKELKSEIDELRSNA
jgi:hypothetical protein